jgi:hypothetical protein
MKIEPSRDPEHFWHVWPMPTGLSRDEAIDYFKKKVKPRDYTFEKFMYWPHKGMARTL